MVSFNDARLTALRLYNLLRSQIFSDCRYLAGGLEGYDNETKVGKDINAQRKRDGLDLIQFHDDVHVFFNFNGVGQFRFLPKDQTVNHEYYKVHLP